MVPAGAEDRTDYRIRAISAWSNAGEGRLQECKKLLAELQELDDGLIKAFHPLPTLAEDSIADTQSGRMVDTWIITTRPLTDLDDVKQLERRLGPLLRELQAKDDYVPVSGNFPTADAFADRLEIRMNVLGTGDLWSPQGDRPTCGRFRFCAPSAMKEQVREFFDQDPDIERVWRESFTFSDKRVDAEEYHAEPPSRRPFHGGQWWGVLFKPASSVEGQEALARRFTAAMATLERNGDLYTILPLSFDYSQLGGDIFVSFQTPYQNRDEVVQLMEANPDVLCLYQTIQPGYSTKSIHSSTSVEIFRRY